MAPPPELSLNPREVAVLAEVLRRVQVPAFTADEWRLIAANAGITGGDTSRNAKYTFSQVRKKMGVFDIGTKAGGAKAGTKRKIEPVDDEEPRGKKRREGAKAVKDEGQNGSDWVKAEVDH